MGPGRAKETVEQKQARLRPGAEWLDAQMKRRGWSGRELARRMDVGPDRISAYLRQQDEPSIDMARRLAMVFGCDEVEVWRVFGKELPAEYRTDEEAIAYVERRYPGLIDRVLGHNPGRTLREPGVKPDEVPRSGDSDGDGSQLGSNAV